MYLKERKGRGEGGKERERGKKKGRSKKFSGTYKFFTSKVITYMKQYKKGGI